MSDINAIKTFLESLNNSTSAENAAELIGNLFKKASSVKIFDSTMNASDILPKYWDELAASFKNAGSFLEGKMLVNNSKLVYPIMKNGQLSGAVEIENGTPEDKEILEIIAPVISLKFENLILNNSINKSINFHNAMKNIAKIIESQYELSYIIPIIGEILDTFIENHLIYIFLKSSGGKSKLVWPASCLDHKICSTMQKIPADNDVSFDKTKKTAYFPLVSENNTIGCIVTKSTEGPIAPQEIYYVQQLAKQTATTITRAKVYSEILKYATLDALTGFYNRRQLDERLKQEMAGAKRRNTPLCAIMADIDFFKQVNDTYGHAAGDLTLKTVAKTVRSQLREYDIAARYGGEEFVIILPYTDESEALKVAERLRKSVENKSVDLEKINTGTKTKNLSVTMSLGVCRYDKKFKDTDLITNADRALYRAKENGRNQVIAFSELEKQ